MKHTVILVQDRVTKGAVRFSEVGQEHSISQSYLRKDFLRKQGFDETTWPREIKVTIEAGAGAEEK